MDLWGIVAVTLLLFLAFIGGLGVERCRGPALVGEIAVGALLGPHCLGVVTEKYAEGLALLGDMGLLLLVFEGGLTMDIVMLKSVGTKAFLVAFSGTLLPVIMGWGLMTVLGFHAIEAFASGTALSATAIGFALRLLQDLDLVNTPQGQLITAAAMIDDVLSLLVLAVLKAVHEEPSAWHFVRPVVASLVVFGLGLLLRTVAASKMEDVHLQKALLELPSWQPLCTMVFLALTMSFAANLFYSTTLLGTFMAGLICGAIPVAKVTWDSSSLPNHIIPWAVRLFFAASVGFSIPVYALFHGPAIKFGLALTVAAFAGKFASGVFGMLPPDPWLSAIQVGCAMIGRGELGFMMASESLESGLLGDTAFSATVWALTLATIGGPILFQKAVKLSYDPKATTYGVYTVSEARL